jgi:hypothetical protein
MFEREELDMLRGGGTHRDKKGIIRPSSGEGWKGTGLRLKNKIFQMSCECFCSKNPTKNIQKASHSLLAVS